MEQPKLSFTETPSWQSSPFCNPQKLSNLPLRVIKCIKLANSNLLVTTGWSSNRDSMALLISSIGKVVPSNLRLCLGDCGDCARWCCTCQLVWLDVLHTEGGTVVGSAAERPGKTWLPRTPGCPTRHAPEHTCMRIEWCLCSISENIA